MRIRQIAVATVASIIAASTAVALPPNAKSARLVARYDVQSTHRTRSMRITISDSAGTLAATYRINGDRTSRPMTVNVEGNDLLLTAIDDKGAPVQLLLRGQNGSISRTMTGEWLIGEDQGTLTGTVRR